ncbi:Trypsin inhibitor DE-3 [Senna tora]|uniref:Trypsin inhibitor DE-3 n=1 Tax=Senna tora TaxID=362788 RepID=A0A834W8V0_9FABA|nr:Trypsin inhibitor DE-3 [Senna tora]
MQSSQASRERARLDLGPLRLDKSHSRSGPALARRPCLGRRVVCSMCRVLHDVSISVNHDG